MDLLYQYLNLINLLLTPTIHRIIFELLKYFHLNYPSICIRLKGLTPNILTLSYSTSSKLPFGPRDLASILCRLSPILSSDRAPLL